MDSNGLILLTAATGWWEGYSQRTVRTAGEEGPLVLWPSWAQQWYEPASVLEAAGSRRLLLGPLRRKAPFRYQEKRVSGVGLRLLLQLSVTACPSATSAAGLMRRRTASRKGREEGSAPLHACGFMPPTTGSAPGFPSPNSIVGSSGRRGISSVNLLMIQEGLVLNANSALIGSSWLKHGWEGF